MHMTYGIQTFDVWPKKMNHVFNVINITVYFWYIRNNFFFPATWQQKKNKKLHIESWTRLFRWGVYWSLDRQICTHSHKNKERRKGKRFLLLFWLCYHSSKLNLTTVRKNPVNKFVVGLLSFIVVWILDTVIVLFFQFELQMAVHIAFTEKKVCEGNNFWCFF